MLHPSFSELMKKANEMPNEGEIVEGSEEWEKVDSRYTLVMACAKRARQINDGAETLDGSSPVRNPKDRNLSIAVREFENGKVHLVKDRD